MIYRPFCGAAFPQTRLLLVSESAFSWYDEVTGELMHPNEQHPRIEIEHIIENFDTFPDSFLRRLTMALAGMARPSKSERQLAWDQCAYTIYVQGSVGDAARQRPIAEMFEASKQPFLHLLNELQPKRVVVVGLEAWKNMPNCEVFLTRDVQAYRLNTGDLVWCMALGHTAGYEWPGWATAHDAIDVFRGLNLPSRCS